MRIFSYLINNKLEKNNINNTEFNKNETQKIEDSKNNGVLNDEDDKAHSNPWTYDGEPTTVRMLINVGEDEFNNRYKKQVEEKFPNIELELMAGDPTNNSALEELFAK